MNRNNRQKARSAFFGNNSGLETSKYSLSGFSMPLPPIELQQQFAAFVAQVDKSRFGGMLRLLNSLSGIMHASFFSVADTD
ncbi:MAG: hypothetical protein ACLT26_05005 [Bifidobacterium adolescentis]